MKEHLTLEKNFINDFQQNFSIISKDDNDNLKKLRNEAIHNFEKSGFPNRNNELWRFTDVLKILHNSGRMVHPFSPPADINTPVQEIFKCDVNQLDTYDVATINGWFPNTIPQFQKINQNCVIGSLKHAFSLFPEIIDKHFSKYAPIKDNPFIALNTSFVNDGIFAYFPDNARLEKPLQLVSLASQPEHSLMQQFIQPRNLIVVGKNANINLVICDHTLSPDSSFSNVVTEVFVDENSKVEITRLQNLNNKGTMVSSLFIHQEKNSKLTTNTITLNGGFTRNNLHIVLNGEFAEANIYGLYLMDRNQHVDNSTFIDHVCPETNSNELFKGILDEQASGVFRGRILVRKDAQKINSYQKNNTLLLTDETKMNTMPQLEIYADDVKCSHGATVGYLGANELFYLRSRGICEREARIMLMNSFAKEIIDKISIPALHDRITYLVSKRLRGELSYCASCVLNCRD